MQNRNRSEFCIRTTPLAIAALMTALCSSAAAFPPDNQVRQLLIGYWVTPSGNPDATDTEKQGPRTLEQYNADGTGSVFIYGDRLCGTLKFTGIFKWSVDQGVLVTTIPTGAQSTDQILSINGNAMLLRFIGGGSEREMTEHRIRSVACPK